MLPAQLGQARGCCESSPRGRPVPALALPTQASHVTSVPSFPHEQDGAVSSPEDVTRTREPACRAASCLPSGAALLMPHPPPAPRPGCPFVCALSCATPGLHRRCDTLVPAAARPVPSLLLTPIQAVLARYSSVRISGTACRVPRGRPRVPCWAAPPAGDPLTLPAARGRSWDRAGTGSSSVWRSHGHRCRDPRGATRVPSAGGAEVRAAPVRQARRDG